MDTHIAHVHIQWLNVSISFPLSSTVDAEDGGLADETKVFSSSLCELAVCKPVQCILPPAGLNGLQLQICTRNDVTNS